MAKRTAKKTPTRKTKLKPRGKPFAKGNKESSKGGAATKGKPNYDREALLARKIDNVTVSNYMSLNAHLTPQQLVERLKTEEVSTLEAMIIKIMLKGYRTGDVTQTNFILERLIGKVPNEVNHNVKNPYEGMTDEELRKERERLNAINRNKMNFEEKHNPRLIAQQEEAAEYERARTVRPDTTDSD